MSFIKNTSLFIFRLLKKRWYVLIIFLLIGGFFLYQQKVTRAAEEKKASYVVRRETLQETLSVSGNIDAEEKADLRFQTGGKLSWVGIKEGDRVKKYQGIASLDQREVEKQIQKNLNSYMKTRWSFEQTKQDNKEAQYKDGDLGDKMKRLIDQSQFDLNNSVLDVELRALAKEYAFLSSPIEGVVTRADVTNAGINITPQTTYQIVNPNTMYFSAVVDQTEVSKIFEGQEGEIMFDAFPDTLVRGYVDKISYTPKEGETGTVYEIRMKIDTLESAYRLGMTGDVTFILKEKPRAIVVPDKYIITENGQKFVEKKVQDQRQRVKVEVGEDFDGNVEIKSGLAEGDVIYEILK